MRVLEAITPSRIGGAEVYVADLCEGFAALGAHVELFCPKGRPFVDYAAGRGLSCISWKTRGKLDPVTVARLAGLIRRERIDVVHTHLSTAGLLGSFAAKLARRSSVAHVHGLNSATCFRYSTAIIAVSEAVSRHLQAQGIPADRIHVVHNGVDLTKFQPMPVDVARRECGIEPSAAVVGVFGRLSSEKGQRFAFDAVSHLVGEFPGLLLLVVGDGKDRDDLARLASSLGIADSVRFVGFQPDIRGLMSACDVVLAPSLKEGFGLVAVNAMALERPVVATTAGGLGEIVVRNETGLLVPPSDPGAIAESVRALLHDTAARTRMGKAGRKRAEECFDLKKQTTKTLRLLAHFG